MEREKMVSTALATPRIEGSLFENIRNDFRSHGRDLGSQGFWVMVVYRFGRWRFGIKSGIVCEPLSLIYKFLFKTVQILTGIELPCEVIVRRFSRSTTLVASLSADMPALAVIAGSATVSRLDCAEPTSPLPRPSATTSTSVLGSGSWVPLRLATIQASGPMLW